MDHGGKEGHQAGGRGEAEGQAADFPRDGTADVRAGVIDPLEDRRGVRLQGLSRFGEFHAATGAVEQAGAQVFLQGLDGQAQGTLGHFQAFGRATEVQFFGQDHEETQVAQVQ
ncbi:hypothetical protein D9M71_775110 [compost metagenome]